MHSQANRTTGTDIEIVKTYLFEYGSDDVNSYLKQVRESGSDGTNLNATIFKYGDIPAETTEGATSIPFGSDLESFSGDYDGDGKDDILTGVYTIENGIRYYSQFKVYKHSIATNSYSLLSTTTLDPGYTLKTIGRSDTRYESKNGSNLLQNDCNGDGYDDIMSLNIATTGTAAAPVLSLSNVTVYNSNAGISFTPQSRSISLSSGARLNANGNYFYPGDFNGDGILEFITILGNAGSVFTPIMHSDFITNGAPSVLTLSPPYIFSLENWINSDKIQVMDFNGDGRSDLMLIKDNITEIFTFNGAVASRLYSGNFPTKDHALYFGDFNGDRKTDLFTKLPSENFHVKAVSTGTGFVNSSVVLQNDTYANAAQRSTLINIGDFNGDGRSDIYHDWWRRGGSSSSFVAAAPLDGLPTTEGKDVYYSTGDSFKKTQIYYYYNPIACSTCGGSRMDVRQVSDVNGDGRNDLIYVENSNAYVKFFRKDGQENLLQKVSNGLNHITEWNYKKLSDGGTFYTSGGASTYPVNNIQPTLFTVSESKTPNGIGGTTNIQYTYEEAKLHRAGKGFLGFKKVTGNNLATGVKIISENEFNTTFIVPAPYKTTTYQGATLLSETTTTNEFVALPNNRFWFRTNGTTTNNSFEGRNETVANVYDTDGNITKITSKIKNTGDAFDLLTSVTDAVYQTIGSLPLKSIPSSVTVTNTRNGQSAFSVKTDYGYNSIGQLTSKTDFSGSAQSVITSYGYNNLGNIITTTITPASMTARISSNEYDLKGRFPLTSTNPLNQTSTSTYDAKFGKPLTTIGIDGLSTSHEYDPFGRLKKTTLPEGFSVNTSYGWDISGNAVWFTLTEHPGKPDIKTWADILGRTIKTQTEGFGGEWITQDQTYDAKGNIATSTQPYKSGETYLTTTNTYDAFNRPETVSSAIGTNTYNYAYSNGSLTTTVTNPAGQESSGITDATGKTTRATDNGGTLHYSYNSNGNLTEVKNGSIIMTTSQYDIYGRQTQLIDKNGGTSTYAHDALGQLTSQTNPKGTTTLEYNLLGQVMTRTGGEGVTSYEYYPSGNASVNKVKKVTGFSGNTEDYTYNALGYLTTYSETIDGTAHATNYSYNTYGDVISTGYASGFGTKHSYDANGFLNTIKNTAETVTLYTSNGTNGLGQVTGYTLGNTLTSTNTYNYGFPTKLETPGAQNLNLVWNYTTGNLTSRNDAIKSKTESFTYDNLNRLLSATVTGITGSMTATYASNGNISSKTDAGGYTYHPTLINAVTGVINSGSVVPSVQQDISYNAFNQPQTISENGNSLSYTYGADYERIKSVESSSVGTVTRYYLGAYEKNVTSSTTKYVHYIASPAGLIAIVERQGTTDTYHYTYTDHLGSILTVTTNTGAVEAEQNFDAWGRRRNITTWVPLLPTAATTLPDWLYRGYTSHEHLDNFGLINMNGRLYDPVLGRMLSPDNYVSDASFTQDFNRYTYARNNPLVYTDPDGNFWNFVIGAALGGFAGFQIGKAQGATGWGLLGYTLAGAGIGALTAGVGDGVLGMFSTVAKSGATAASIGAYATSGAISGALAGGAFAALGGQDVGKGALLGGLFGGASGALGGFIKYSTYENSLQRSLERALGNKANWLAQIGGPGDKPLYGGTFGAVTITRPWWQGLGFTLARGISAVLTLPFILDGDVTKNRPNNYTVMYRNMSSEEYSSFMRKGQNFGFGKGMFDSKQFWMTPDGLQMWNSSNMTTGPYNVAISVPTKIIGPNGLVQLRALDGHLAGTVQASNLNAFNRVKIVIHVFGN